MPSHKALKSVVHSLVDSFTSLMNYYEDDYVMGHLVYASWLTGATELRVKLLSGETNESSLLVPPVRASVARLVDWFPDIVRRSNSDMDFVTAAEMIVTVDPTARRQHAPGSEFQESPFTCAVHITDDRGKKYSYALSDWWYPERPPPQASTQAVRSLTNRL